MGFDPPAAVPSRSELRHSEAVSVREMALVSLCNMAGETRKLHQPAPAGGRHAHAHGF